MRPPTKSTVAALVGGESGLKAVSGDESYLNRIGGQTLDLDEMLSLRRIASRVGVTQRFREVVDYFGTPEGENDAEGADGLDSARHALRWLRTTNLEETRLIICSMAGPLNYPDIMRMLTEEEFIGMHERVVMTTEPNYLARWTSHPQVVSYQRRFMRAARAVNEGESGSPLEEKLQEVSP